MISLQAFFNKIKLNNKIKSSIAILNSFFFVLFKLYKTMFAQQANLDVKLNTDLST